MSRASNVAWVGALVIIFGCAGCDRCGGRDAVSEAHPSPPRAASATDPRAFPTVTPTRRTVQQTGGRSFELLRFRFPLTTTTVSVVDLHFETTLSEALDSEGASLAINGGYWDTERLPEGLTIVEGREISALSPTLGGGILVIDDGVGRLFDVESENLVVDPQADFAQQCMPRIVVDGALNIRRDDGRGADRTALCLRDEGRTLDVYVARSDQPDGHGGPTLWSFGEILVAEGCEAALNLDGGSSTGAVWRGSEGIERRPPRVPLRLAILLK